MRNLTELLSTGYQYTDTSDIDVNFVLNISDERVKELAAEMYTEINGKNPLNEVVKSFLLSSVNFQQSKETLLYEDTQKN